MFVFCPEAAMSDERGSGEKITGAVWLRGILWLLMSFLFLYVCGTACLAAAHFVQNGVNEKSLQDVGGFLLKLRQNPEYLLAAYAGRGFLFWLFVSDS